MLLPAERTVVLNLAESPRNDPPLRRHGFTIAHEIGHWICHCLEGRAARLEPSYCRATDIANDVDRAIEREANIFASELLMPEAAVRVAWEELVAQSREVDPAAAMARRVDVSPSAMGGGCSILGCLSLDPPFCAGVASPYRRRARGAPRPAGPRFFPAGRSHPDGALRAGKGS